MPVFSRSGWVILGVSLAWVGCKTTEGRVGTDTEDSGSRAGEVDADQDGYSLGEGDCDDSQPAVNPSAADVVGDGVDQNCDEVDGVDADGDGIASVDSGGEDCDDALASVNPFATDLVDGSDNNCDGVDGTDSDGDGYASVASGGEDCDDQYASIYPDAPDVVDSGIDQNCDGVDGVDADLDGYASVTSGGTDCDDLDPMISPAAVDDVGDGFDQNCDGIDGTDADRDGAASVDSGGVDCDDTRAEAYPGAADTVGDSFDNNCDGNDGVDGDRDTFASVASGGPDCDDNNPAVFPGAADTVGDGLDQSCDAVDGTDADGDGAASEESGGADCDDADPAVSPAIAADSDGASLCEDCDDSDGARYPGNLELCNAIDDDCDATVDFAALVDACARSEGITVGAGGALDVLFVVDNSCSMVDEQEELSAVADEFLTPLVGTDWHIGVVTTDMDAASHRGRLRPGPDGSRWIDGSDDLLTATGWLSKTVEQGNLGSGIEKPLDASISALDLLAATDNAGFSRPEADLAVIFLTDEPDYSSTTTSNWENWFADIQLDRVASVHGFIAPASSTQVSSLIATFGGIEVDVATSNWGPAAADIAATILPGPSFDGTFPLTDLADPATLVVTVTEPGGTPTVLVDGVDFVYDAILNAIVFTGYVPPDGTEIVVDYRAVP